MQIEPSDIFVVVATAIAWWSLIPQIRKLVRTRDATGVSSTWPAIGLVSNAGWTAYLLAQRLWAAAPSTAVMTVFYGLVLWALARSARPLGRSLAAGGLWAATLTVTGFVGGWGALGLMLASAYLIQFGPAVVAAFRSRRPSGVSPLTWAIIGVESMLWGTYGLFNNDVPIMIYGGVGASGAALILGRYRSAIAGSSTLARGSVTTKRV